MGPSTDAQIALKLGPAERGEFGGPLTRWVDRHLDTHTVTADCTRSIAFISSGRGKITDTWVAEQMPATGSMIDHHAAERQGEPDCPQPTARISVFPDAVGRTADADVQKDEAKTRERSDATDSSPREALHRR